MLWAARISELTGRALLTTQPPEVHAFEDTHPEKHARLGAHGKSTMTRVKFMSWMFNQLSYSGTARYSNFLNNISHETISGCIPCFSGQY